jgi:hypothetical protein
MMGDETGDRYPGARAFRDSELDRKLFFGRDRESDTLLHLILAEPMVVVYGKSGVGKTSLLNAGVLARLRAEGYLPLRARFNDISRDPFLQVLDGVATAAQAAGLEFSASRDDTLWGYFHTLELWKDDTLLAPILILDQFEELFTLRDVPTRRTFVAQLSSLLRGPESEERDSPSQRDNARPAKPPPAKVVFSIREDFLGDLEEFAEKIPQVLNTRFRVTHLGREEATKALETPASVVDARLSTSCFSFAPGTPESIISFLARVRRGGSAGTEIEPFQLQLICQHVESTVRRSQAAGTIISFKDLGGESGLKRILGSFYDDQISSTSRRLQRRRLRRLCERGLISPTRRRLSLEEGEIARRFRVDQQGLRELVQSRLLRTEPRVGSNYYELTHDSLVEPILDSRKQHRRRRRVKRAVAAVFVGAVIAVGVVVGLLSWGSTTLTISKETTYFVGPRDADGMVNYAAVLNTLLGQGVTPENNAACVVGPLFYRKEDRPGVIARLGVDLRDEDFPRWVGGGPALGFFESYMQEKGELEARLLQVRPQLAGTRTAIAYRLEEEFRICGSPESPLPWTEEHCPALAAWLELNEKALKAVEEATKRTHYWVPLPEDRRLTEAPIPSLLTVRNVADALRRRALLRLGQADDAGAVSDLLTLMRLGGLVGRSYSLIEILIAMTVQGLAVDVVPLVRSRARKDTRSANAAWQSFRDCFVERRVVKAINLGERAVWLSVLSDVYSGRVAPNELRYWGSDSIPMFLVSRSPINWDHVFREVNRLFDEAATLADEVSSDRDHPRSWEGGLPWRGLDAGDVAGSPRMALSEVLVIRPVASELPGAVRAVVSENELNAQLRLARSSLALELYHSRRAQYPVNLTSAAKELGEPGVNLVTERGYRFRYQPLSRVGDRIDSYTLVAIPVGPGMTGVRSFCTEESGPIRWSATEEAMLAEEGCPAPPNESAVRSRRGRPPAKR